MSQHWPRAVSTFVWTIRESVVTVPRRCFIRLNCGDPVAVDGELHGSRSHLHSYACSVAADSLATRGAVVVGDECRRIHGIHVHSVWSVSTRGERKRGGVPRRGGVPP